MRTTKQQQLVAIAFNGGPFDGGRVTGEGSMPRCVWLPHYNIVAATGPGLSVRYLMETLQNAGAWYDTDGDEAPPWPAAGRYELQATSTPNAATYRWRAV